jgi:hypothetical protein
MLEVFFGPINFQIVTLSPQQKHFLVWKRAFAFRFLTQPATHWQTAAKLLGIKFHENPLSVSGIHASGQTNLNARSSVTYGWSTDKSNVTTVSKHRALTSAVDVSVMAAVSPKGNSRRPTDRVVDRKTVHY